VQRRADEAGLSASASRLLCPSARPFRAHPLALSRVVANLINRIQQSLPPLLSGLPV
jgi:hypothetical protein